MNRPIRSIVEGAGGYLPERVLTNHDLAGMVDTTDEWIVERTGIRERRIAADGERTSDLAAASARRSLAAAGLTPADVDLIIVATATPDLTFPSTATIVQHKLGITRGAAFDIQAVCSGFVYALAVADGLIGRGAFKTALVIGAETFSRILDWSDRTTCVLFGDGAGSVVMRAARDDDPQERGLLASSLNADGRHCDLLYVDGGPSATRTVGHLRMVGNQVFRHAVGKISAAMTETLDAAGVPASAVDWFVPHQANQRILDGVARKLDIDASRVVATVDRHGNTSAASIPLALAVAVEDGRVKPGDLVLVEAMGGGFAWGAALLRW